jgi:hypothetical protein
MKTRTQQLFSSFLSFSLALALGLASCSGDKEPDNGKNGGTSTPSLTLKHPNYSNGKLNVIVGTPVTIGKSNVEVSMKPMQEYTLAFVPDSNEYFTFTSVGVLTGNKEGENAGNVEIRVIAASGKTLAAELIPVNVVGTLVTILNHDNYENDTFRVAANEEFILTKAQVKVEPENPSYRVAFAPKTTRYFTFNENGILHGRLDGTDAIEVLVLEGSDTVKVQPFNVKVSPDPSWVNAVSVNGNKTMYFMSSQTGTPTLLKNYFSVTGGANQNLRFTSSNTNVATVDATSGMVTVKDVPSYAFIKATAVDGSERADSIRVTTAWVRPPVSCDFNLCNILTDNNKKEDPRYVSCQVWDGNVATSWVYRMDRTFTRARYPGVQFLMGKYGKELVPGDWNGGYPRCDWVLGCKAADESDKVEKKETNWGVWSAGTQGIVTFKKLVVTRGFYTDERGRKIFQSGTVYLELWYDDSKEVIMAGKHTFTDNPNDNEWVVDLTTGSFDVWSYADVEANKTNAGQKKTFPNGVPTTEMQMMLSTEGAQPASDGKYYWAIADVLGFER